MTAEDLRTRRLRELLTLTDNILARAEAGHRQSIGSIDNVRMVQFGVDELHGYRDELTQLRAVLDTEGDRQEAQRLTWLADRVQAQHSQLWPSKDNPYTLSHDRLTCDHPDHAGCHLYALIESIRKIVDTEGDRQAPVVVTECPCGHGDAPWHYPRDGFCAVGMERTV